MAADEVERPKPDPQLYVTAFEQLGAQPHSGVALEDSATGVASARASGAFVITVPSQPGKRLDGDYITSTLADPLLTSWAQKGRQRLAVGICTNRIWRVTGKLLHIANYVVLQRNSLPSCVWHFRSFRITLRCTWFHRAWFR